MWGFFMPLTNTFTPPLVLVLHCRLWRPKGGRLQRKKGKIMNDINKLSDQIKDQAEFDAHALLAMFIKTQDQLDDAIKTMQDTTYISHWEKMPDIRRISQLGLAVVKLGDAYSAMNRVGCI